jgi:hypothetical protein
MLGVARVFDGPSMVAPMQSRMLPLPRQLGPPHLGCT